MRRNVVDFDSSRAIDKSQVAITLCAPQIDVNYIVNPSV